MSSWDHLFGNCHSACSGINLIILPISSRLVGGFLTSSWAGRGCLPVLVLTEGRPPVGEGLPGRPWGSFSHPGPSRAARGGGSASLLTGEVRPQSAHRHRHHRPELPHWLLRLSFNSGSGLHQSQLGSAWNPAPSAILDPGQCGAQSLTRRGGGRGRGRSACPRGRPPAFPPPARRPLSRCSCSSQTPPQPVARGLVSVCRLGQPQWGSSRPRRGPPLHLPLDDAPQSPARFVLGGPRARGAALPQS